MTAGQLNEQFNQAPVVIHLTNGDRIHVPQRDFVAVAPDGESVSAYDTRGRHWMIDSLNIASIVTLPKRRKRAA
jgi:hypothetical protein